jgi:hypothetical protein
LLNYDGTADKVGYINYAGDKCTGDSSTGYVNQDSGKCLVGGSTDLDDYYYNAGESAVSYKLACTSISGGGGGSDPMTGNVGWGIMFALAGLIIASGMALSFRDVLCGASSAVAGAAKAMSAPTAASDNTV